MSEIPQIGRNPVYIGTLALFVVLQVPTALSVNFGMLLAFRFITGFVGSPVLATGGASIADLYRPSKRAYGIGIWGISAVCTIKHLMRPNIKLTMYLGLRSSAWSTCWRVRRSSRRLEVDDLGAHVALGILSCVVDLLPT